MGGLFALGAFLFAAIAGGLYYFAVFDRSSVFERALTLARNGSYMDARALIRSRIEREPDDPRGQYYMSRIYALEGNEDQELEHLKEIKRIGRYAGEIKPTEVIRRIAQVHYEADRLGDAFENYLDLLQYDPNNEAALAHIAFMAIGQGEFDLAEKYFKRLVKAAPTVSEYHIARGVGLSMLKDKEEALEELRSGLDQAPKNQTAQFLAALQYFKNGDAEKSAGLVETLLDNATDPYVSFIANRLATAVYYMTSDYAKSLTSAERCMEAAAKEEWDAEEYDARLAVAYMAMLTGDLEKANEHLLELEIRNSTDEMVMKISDFRMDLEEQVAQVDQVSPRGFDFVTHLQDWARKRFADDAMFRLSGLKQSQEFDVLAYFTTEGAPKPKEDKAQMIDPDELIGRFNNLKGESLKSVSQSIIASLGFKIQSELDYRDKDGKDYIATSLADKKIKALFRIRQWSNQPISDIFLREQQAYMNELKVNQGFVVAGARLTDGAEQALNNLKKITVVNETSFGEILQKVL
ncbi:MAG: tetratricopeptide repeat protein [bacterium]|nr:tetratricopeptide repeat protein [bacterium]